MYVGASQAARLAERLEAREEIFKFQTIIEMKPQERAAAEGDVDTLSSLIKADVHLPPPEVPNNVYRFNTPLRESALSSFTDQPDLADLGRQHDALNRIWLLLRSEPMDEMQPSGLSKRIVEVAEQMAALDQGSGGNLDKN